MGDPIYGMLLLFALRSKQSLFTWRLQFRQYSERLFIEAWSASGYSEKKQILSKEYET